MIFCPISSSLAYTFLFFFFCVLSVSLVCLYYRFIIELTNSKISGSSAEKRV